jgi:hypothetical protein
MHHPANDCSFNRASLSSPRFMVAMPGSLRCGPNSEARVALVNVYNGEISWYSGINFEISDLAAVCSNKFSRADPQNLNTRVDLRPKGDPRARVN